MIDWLFGTVLGKCVMTFLISLLPVVELRGGIPYGISQGLDPWLAFAASALGNMLPVPFILLFIRKILHWMKRYPRLGNVLPCQAGAHAQRTRAAGVRKSELVGLCILVAIPAARHGRLDGRAGRRADGDAAETGDPHDFCRRADRRASGHLGLYGRAGAAFSGLTDREE